MSSPAFQTWPSEDSQNDDLRQQLEQALRERDEALTLAQLKDQSAKDLRTSNNKLFGERDSFRTACATVSNLLEPIRTEQLAAAALPLAAMAISAARVTLDAVLKEPKP